MYVFVKTYSLSSERTAQEWANRCNFAHSSSEQRNKDGENLYAILTGEVQNRGETTVG